MARWDEIQENARKLINEGLTMLKSGAHDAGFLAETTASAARLHMDAGRNRLKRYRALYELGEALYKKIVPGSAATGIPISPTALALAEKVHQLDREIKEEESKLERFSVVKAREPSPSKATKTPCAHHATSKKTAAAKKQAAVPRKKTSPRSS